MWEAWIKKQYFSCNFFYMSLVYFLSRSKLCIKFFFALFQSFQWTKKNKKNKTIKGKFIILIIWTVCIHYIFFVGSCYLSNFFLCCCFISCSIYHTTIHIPTSKITLFFTHVCIFYFYSVFFLLCNSKTHILSNKTMFKCPFYVKILFKNEIVM